jgi:hypothetical protein
MKPQPPKIANKYTAELREALRLWLSGKPRSEVRKPVQKQLGTNNIPKSLRQVFVELLSVKSWAEARQIRKQTHNAAKQTATQRKKEAKRDASSQSRAA